MGVDSKLFAVTNLTDEQVIINMVRESIHSLWMSHGENRSSDEFRVEIRYAYKKPTEIETISFFFPIKDEKRKLLCYFSESEHENIAKGPKVGFIFSCTKLSEEILMFIGATLSEHFDTYLWPNDSEGDYKLISEYENFSKIQFKKKIVNI